jgi:hypothetical protein
MHALLKKLKVVLKNEVVLLVLIFILCVGALIMPNAIRMHVNSGIPAGEESYKDLIISGELLSSAKYLFSGEKAKTSYIDGSATNSIGSNIHSNYGPEHFILALFIMVFGQLKSLIVLPFVCGIISFFILYFILKEYQTDYKLYSLFMFVLIMSPIFIYTFSVFTRFCIIIPLLLLAVLFIKKTGIEKYASLAVFLIFPFFGLDVFLVSIISLWVLFLFSSTKENRMFLKAIIFPELIIGCIYFIWLSFTGRFYLSNNIINTNLFSENLSMFGATVGFSLFILILGAIGIISTWKNKKQYYSTYLIMLVLIIAALFFSPKMKIPLVFFISFFASIGFLSLLHVSWSFKIVGKLTISAIIFGIILSSILYAAAIVDMEPQKQTVDALLWLKENSKDNVMVLSSYQNAIYIEYFAGRKQVISYDFEYTPDGKERYNDTISLLKTRDFKEATAIINKYSVDYIMIDDKMKPLMYSDNNVKGLSFLLENIESFKNVFSHPGIDVWKVKRLKETK